MDKDNRIIGYWLLFGALLVLAMVILGGYTRLSHSGLSMVTWKPITGVAPPLTNQQWEEEFELYKTSPEYKKRNYDFTLKEFKEIYWPEYLHRLLGRLLGITFLIPFVYFLVRGKLKDKHLFRNLVIIFLLGGMQGLVGWYMVKSGLLNDPNVSHYRLALHFITALTLYAYIFWTGIKVLFRFKPLVGSETRWISRLLKLTFILLVIQLIYGAFVAGLKAGLIYTTFPKMGEEWFPVDLKMAFDIYGVKCVFEFPPLVQFIHRWLAVIIVLFVGWIYLKAKQSEMMKSQRIVVNIMLITVLAQFSLGIFTLLYQVPISLGVLHQVLAIILFTSVIAGVYMFHGAFYIGTIGIKKADH